MKLSCADLGTSECQFVAEGATAEEVKGKLMEHAKQAHADKLAAMNEEQKAEMDKKMDELLAAQAQPPPERPPPPAQ
ncbi:MAG: DUF1059 domain-containing protein [Candidatus Micrarchaeota archaeon]